MHHCKPAVHRHIGVSTNDWVYAGQNARSTFRSSNPRQRRTDLNIEFVDLPGERIPLKDATIDTVVSTFTLCTIPGVVEAIRGMGRVLRPGGKFLFFEHGLSPDPKVRRWQQWSEPIPYWVFAGCHVTRDIPSLITSGGFQIDQVETAYLARFPKSWSYTWWGTAIPQSRQGGSPRCGPPSR